MRGWERTKRLTAKVMSLPRLDACGVGAQSGDAAFVEQQRRGVGAEAGEVEAAVGVGAQVGRRVVPAFRPAG